VAYNSSPFFYDSYSFLLISFERCGSFVRRILTALVMSLIPTILFRYLLTILVVGGVLSVPMDVQHGKERKEVREARSLVPSPFLF